MTTIGRKLRRIGRLLLSACPFVIGGCAQTIHRPNSLSPLIAIAQAQPGSVSQKRAAMVENIRADIRDADPLADTKALENALRVVGNLPRERFVRKAGRGAAYVDLPQEIGHGQTISDPYVVSIMTASLDLPRDANVLDIGTGSGYQAAVLARIARHVTSIEIVKSLAYAAFGRLQRLGIRNVEVHWGDGFLGWVKTAPFDGIVVAASAAEVPPPLLDQLKPGGRLIMPIGKSDTSTQLLKFTKLANGTVVSCSLGGALFVPLTGTHTKPFARNGLLDRSIPLCFAKPIVGVI